MAGKKLEYTIGVDSDQGITGVKNFSRTVQQELKKVEDDFDETATAGDRVATVLSAMAKDLDDELGRAALAADALAQALGPELAAKADVGSIVGDLTRMGLTFEDIVADADKLATSLKELDQVQIKGIDSGLSNASTKMGQLRDNSDQTKSVMANMAGNAAQDLGAVAGVAGTAGVAIGQLAEYASEGNISLGNLAKLAGPMIALAGAVEVVSTVMEGLQLEKEFDAANVKQFTDAMREAKTAAQSVKEEVLELGKFELVVSGSGFLGLGKHAQDILPDIEAVVGGLNEFNDLVKDPAAIAALRKRAQQILTPKPQGVEQATDAEREHAASIILVAEAAERQAEDIELARQAQELFRRTNVLTTKEVEEAVTAWEALEDPVSRFPASYRAIADALRRGVTPPAKDIELIMEATGLSIEDILTNAQGINTALDENKRVTDEWKRSVDDVGVAMAEAMTPFEDGTAAADAFKTALDKVDRSKGLDVLERFGDTREAIGEVFKVIKENDGVIPDIFKTGRESSRDFRDALEDLSDTYKTDLVDLLEETGGNFDKVRQRVKELRLTLAAEFATKLGLDLGVKQDRDQVLSMVDAVLPTDREVEVGIKLANKDLIKLKADLAIEHLQTLAPETALQLKVDMAEGEITPRVALATAQQIFDETGLQVDLGVNTRKADQDLVDFAAEERHTTLGVGITGLEDAAFAIDAGPGGRGWPAIEVPVKPVIVPGGYSYITGGGAGTLAAPGPGTLAVGPHAAATSSSSGPITVPVIMPPQQKAPEIHLHATVNTAVAGDPFAIAQAVEDGLRRTARLMPTNP